MSPTLNDGDDILVNRDDNISRLRDGIYALRWDGALVVKRVALGTVCNRVSIASDNPRYPAWPDMDIQKLEAAYRVIWASRRLK